MLAPPDRYGQPARVGHAPLKGREVELTAHTADVTRTPQTSDASARAARLVRRYLDQVVAADPVAATRLGISDYDGQMPDLAPQALSAHSRDLAVLAAEVDHTRQEISDTRPVAGAPQQTGEVREARQDLELLAAEIDYKRFALDERPRYVLDPLAALETISGGIHELVRPMEVGTHEQCRRLDAAVNRARRIPVLLEQAGSLLQSSPAPNLDVAAQRIPGLIALVRDGLPRCAEQLGVDVSPARDAGEVAAEGLEAYAALLAELADEPTAPWRLGSAHHKRTLASGLGANMDPVQIEDRARTWIAEIAEEMAELAAGSWAKRFPGEPVPTDKTERIRRTLAAVSDTAVARDQLVPEARRAVAEARRFAIETGMVDVPPLERLTIAEVPPYLQGIAVAFITQPPPLRPESGCTYFLSTVPDSWSDAQARSFLREYNPAQLRSLALHEGYPGHFVQLEHAAQHPRLARRLLTRPVFAEGWAVYIEREAFAAGFGDGESSAVEGDDYRITQRKLELRIATNALLDVGLHAGELADDEAMRLLTSVAFQEPAEAHGKLVRAKVTSGQLCSYFVGGEELSDLRRAVQIREGASFDVRSFHQRALSHGTPTTAMVGEALADDAPSHRPFATGT